MKAMKYILMVISMVGVLSVNAQPQTEQPQVQFQSTSTMQASGSTLSSQPMLNQDGTAYNPTAAASSTPSGPRKSFGNNPNDPGFTNDESSPIGDALLPLSLMALAFAGVIYLRRRKLKADN